MILIAAWFPDCSLTPPTHTFSVQWSTVWAPTAISCQDLRGKKP